MAQSVRHKLLAMALLPLALIFPLLVLALMVWSSVAYDRLLITKVRSDLAVASGYFNQLQAEVGAGTRGVAASHALVRAVTGAGEQPQRLLLPAQGEARQQLSDEMLTVDSLLHRERERLGLDFLVLERGAQHAGRAPKAGPSLEGLTRTQAPLTREQGDAARLVLLPRGVLHKLAPDLSHRLNIPLVPTRNAVPSDRQVEDRAMVVLASLPVVDDNGRQWATLHGGTLLNQNLDFIDHLNRIVYPEGSLPFGSQGTATLFLEDVRITTNVRLFQDQRAIGTRVSQAVRDAVLARGQTWLDRAFVVSDWYVSAYEPLLDAHGDRIGMLYVGYLEEPFRWVRYGMLAVMALIFLAVMALAALFSVRWARSIFKPVEQMNDTMRRVEEGDSAARVGPLATRDELGALAGHLDHLLDVVDDNTRHLREWAQTLDRKVAERTQELETSNASLRVAQQQLVKSEKLAAIGQLTASIAHEINNPIAVIQGNLDLMRETLGPHAQPVQGELKLLDEQVERMRLIVTQLLQYARPTEFAGYVDHLDLNQTVTDCLVLVAHLLQQHRIDVERDLRATTGVACNRQELQQVVINLMINAVQAMPDGGVLTLSTRDWFNDQGEPGAVLAVMDQGSGLTAQVRERLFTPFFTTKNDGNGLGLWISQGLVERYGGRLEAANRQDARGAMFQVRLLAEPHVPQASQVSTQDGRPGRLPPAA